MPKRKTPTKSPLRGLTLLLALALLAACAHAPQKKEALMTSNAPARLDQAELALLAKTPDGEALPVLLQTNAESLAILRRSAQSVDWADPALPKLIERLKSTVLAEQGVGIAAPQVGLSRRVILVQRLDKEPEKPFELCLNPEILSFGPEKELGWEGCLSVPAGFGQVERSVAVTVRCQSFDGTTRNEAVSGYVARIFQHEIDHLNGILFIDRMAQGAVLLPKDEYRAMRLAEKAAKEKAAAEAAANGPQASPQNP